MKVLTSTWSLRRKWQFYKIPKHNFKLTLVGLKYPVLMIIHKPLCSANIEACELSFLEAIELYK